MMTQMKIFDIIDTCLKMSFFNIYNRIKDGYKS